MPVRRNPRQNERSLQQDYYSDINRTGNVGSTLLDSFSSGAQNFDPNDAFNRRLEAAQSQFQRSFGRQREALVGSQVRSGRVNTGFGYQDQDRLFADVAGRFAEVSGNAALQANQQRLSQLGLLGGLGANLSGRAMDARGGEYQTLRQQRLQEEADKRRGWGNLLSGVLTAGGTILGGPLGGVLASSLTGGR